MTTTPDLSRPASPDRRPGVAALVPRLLKAAVPIGALGVLFAVDFPLCPMRHVFGIPCPGCGLTRATESLLVGDFAVALAHHPLVPVVLPVVAWMIVRVTLVSAGVLRRDSFDPMDRFPRVVWLGLVVLLLVVWVVRLSGGLGGHPDPVDPSQGLLGRGIGAILGASGS